MRLPYPFAPYVTEIWQKLRSDAAAESLMITVLAR